MELNIEFAETGQIILDGFKQLYQNLPPPPPQYTRKFLPHMSKEGKNKSGHLTQSPLGCNREECKGNTCPDVKIYFYFTYLHSNFYAEDRILQY